MRGEGYRGLWIAGGVLIGGMLVLLQISFLPWLAIKGVYPNVLVAFTVAVGLHFGSWEGLGTGLALGTLTDVLTAHPFGFLAIPLGLVGYVSGIAHRRVLESRFLVPFGMGMVAALLDMLGQYAVADVWGHGSRLSWELLGEEGLQAVATAIVAWGFFLLLLAIHRLQRQERLRVM